MKKSLFFLLILTILNLTSCKALDKIINKNQPNSPNIPYKITQANYTEGNITIIYPQLKELKDTNKEEAINQLIETEALKVLNYYQESTQDLELEITYHIKYQGDGFISIQYTGVGYVKGAAHPNNLNYSSNIDLINIEKIRLKDFVTIDETFIEKFRQGKYIPWGSEANPELEEAIKEVINSYQTEELIHWLKEADTLDQIGTDQQTDTFSYFTKDALVVSIPLPQVLGGYGEIALKYQEILPHIKIKSHLWQQLNQLQ